VARQHLLLVDGDARNLRLLEVSLRRAGFSITSAESAAQALQYLAHSEPDLIISDTKLQGGDGFELCRAVKGDARWATIPFIFLSSATELDDKVRGLELGVEDYLTKPIYVKEVTTRVKMLLQRKQQERLGRKDARTKFSGLLADMAIVDLLQTIEISRKSGSIEFDTDLGRATVWFRDGRVIDAKMGILEGAPAVYRLLGINEGTFEVEFRTIHRLDVIEASTQAVLMEGMRRVDEWVRLLEGLPPLDHVLTIDNRVLAEREEPLAPRETGLMRRFDGHRTIIEIIDDSGEDDLVALGTISGLYFEGLLTDEATGHDEGEEEDDEEGEDEASASTSSATLTRAGVPRLRSQADPVRSAADLPPLPSFPLPFPNVSPGGEHDDVLVGGIPDDVREPPAEDGHVTGPTATARRRTDKMAAPKLDASLAVQQLSSVAGYVAPPMGVARAAAHGELEPEECAPRLPPSPASSIIVRSIAMTPSASSSAAPVAVDGEDVSVSVSVQVPVPWTTHPQLLAESSDDLGRLSALVAVLSQQSTTGSVVTPVEKVHAEVEAARSQVGASRVAVVWWLWAGIGVAALIGAIYVRYGMDPLVTPRVAPAKVEKSAAGLPETKVLPVPEVKLPEPPTKVVEGPPTKVVEAPPPVEPPVVETPPPVEPPVVDSPLPIPVAVDPVAMKRANKLYLAGKAKEALAVVEEVLLGTPEDAQALLLKANILVERRDWAAARAAAQAAIASDAGLAGAYMTLGVIEQEEKQTEAAVAAYEKYLELAPKDRYAATIRQQVKALQRGR
jgi:DNA-binding response OmpR family regulator